MQVSEKDLQWSVKQGIITQEQAQQLWQAWTERGQNQASFTLLYVAYYFGALLVIAAMGWLLNSAWDDLGGWGIAGIAWLYAAVFVVVGNWLWRQNELKVPAGLLYTMAVTMTPLGMYGVQKALQIWPQQPLGHYHSWYHYLQSGWFSLEITTVLAALLALWRRPFPFLTAPLNLALWLLAMDSTPLIFGAANGYAYQKMAVAFGGLLVAVTLSLERHNEDAYAFWGYLCGVLSFWGGLSLMDTHHEWARFGYAALNVVMILLAVLLQRKVFLVCGALGVFQYLGYLSYKLFADSLLFSLGLTFIGLAIMYIAVQYHRHQQAWEKAVFQCLPKGCQQFLQRRQRKGDYLG